MGELELNNLTKVFAEGEQEIVAVDGVNISIKDGEFLVLVGPSGCGKSTTLRSIAGLEQVTSGEIWIDDENVTDRKPKNRKIAMVFQNYALYPHMTARENMAFGLKMTTDLSETEIEERVNETARMMGIEELLEDTPAALSGGQQQRVALGRAIVREPSVFLMDEPLSNLDAKLRTDMRTELQELQQRLGITTIYVTHDQTEAMTMGDRIAVLNNGKLQQIGTPLECYHEPNNRFVAGFIGSPSMNFITTTLTDGKLASTTFEYELTTETSRGLAVTEGDNVILGIRPEDIQPADGDDINSITITVDVVEPLGDTNYVYFQLGETDCTASIPGDTPVSAGDSLEILFPEDRIHLFDETTGETIKNREFTPTDEPAWSANA